MAPNLLYATHGTTHQVLNDLLRKGKRYPRELINIDVIKCQRDINLEISGKGRRDQR